MERLAEDKVYIRAALQGLGVPVPEALALDRDELDFTAVARRLDAPFIAQTPNGAGGQGTYLVRDAADLAAARQAHPHVTRWLLSRYAGDVTINVAGVVHPDGVRLLPASLQISGIPQLGYAFGGYCGSDFATPRVDPGALAQAYLHTGRIGHWLAEQGHRGLFGADIAVSGGDVAFLEVNPRIQGSSWLLSRLQERHGLDPACTSTCGRCSASRSTRPARPGRCSPRRAATCWCAGPGRAGWYGRCHGPTRTPESRSPACPRSA
ncbi:ATP-grasp domain-containing protein [Catellatospora coxensis]